MNRLLTILWIFVGVIPILTAQEQNLDSLDEDQIYLLHADSLIILDLPGEKSQQLLYGNVELYQDSAFFFCDTAYIIGDDVEAFGNIIVQHGDSLKIFGDSLFYSSDTRKAELRGDIVLQQGSQLLYTDRIEYDFETSRAYYTSGGLLQQAGSYLSSKIGNYNSDSSYMEFSDSVIVIHPRFRMFADSLDYDALRKMAYFKGPTKLIQDERVIYCESGYYDFENEVAVFEDEARYRRGDERASADRMEIYRKLREIRLIGNAVFQDSITFAKGDEIIFNDSTEQSTITGNGIFERNGQRIEGAEIFYDGKTDRFESFGRSRISDSSQILSADSIFYDDAISHGVARGNVILEDTSSGFELWCSDALYDKESEYVKAIGGGFGYARPLLKTIMDGDTMYVAADTMVSYRSAKDSTRILNAFFDVRIFKSDFQSICDSLSYTAKDSSFRFYKNPIIWSDTSQFYADSVAVFLKAKKLDRIELVKNALIVNSSDEIYFNQVKGRVVHAFFKSNELRKMDVQGNAESIYFILDDAGYVGMNRMLCSHFLVDFGSNEVEHIRFYEEPQGQMVPMKNLARVEHKLKGFRWTQTNRPMSIEDLF